MRLPLTRDDFWPTAETRRDEPLRYNLNELSGSLGDLGTFLPLAVAMALTCHMSISLIFIFAGLMNIVTGVIFRQPIPVQPMKAIAAVAIAEGLSAGSIAASGMVMGVAMFVLAAIGGVDWIARVIPKPVVRGIQAGVGIKLAWTGLNWLRPLPMIGWDSWILAAAVGAVILVMAGRRQPELFYVFVAGIVLAVLSGVAIDSHTIFAMPSLEVVFPTAQEWTIGLTQGAIPQLPLTLLNSVVAVCALSGDYFPGRGIPPRRMAASVGLMNLVCVPFGGMPMCHGAGGLAAQHHFGARTGGSVVMLGGLKIVAGLLLGGVLLTTLQHYPTSILAILVIVAGLTLARAAKDCLHDRDLIIVIVMIILIFTMNTLVGFLVGSVLAGLFLLIDRRSKATM